jgi:hypothetical protein
MAAPLLVVELPVDAAPEHGRATVAACSAGLRPGRCELSGTTGDEKVTAIAVVSFPAGDRLHPLVEVGRRRDDREVWLSEELAFRAPDSLLEEHRSIGLTIAVLFHALENPDAPGVHDKPTQAPARSSLPAPEPPKPEPPKPEPPKPEPPKPEPPKPEPKPVPPAATEKPQREAPSLTLPFAPVPRAWLAAGGLSGWDPGTQAVRFGAAGSLGLVPVQPLLVGVSGRLRRTGVAGVELTFATLGFGAGASIALSPTLWLRGRVEVVTEHVSAGAIDPQRRVSQSRSLWVTGLGGALDLAWLPGRWWGVAITAAPQRLARGTTVELYRQGVATVSPTSVEAVLSLEVYPFAPERRKNASASGGEGTTWQAP